MSIAILKRKAMNGNPRLSPISGNNPLGFALNGTRRVKGVVGPTNLGASKSPTLGSHQSCFTCNSNEIIKPSVKNTKGMLSSRYRGILYGAWPKSVVKQFNLNDNHKKVYDNCITKLHIDSIACNSNVITDYIKTCNCDNKVINKVIYTKPGKGAISQSTYLNDIYKKNNS